MRSMLGRSANNGKRIDHDQGTAFNRMDGGTSMCSTTTRPPQQGQESSRIASKEWKRLNCCAM